VIDVFVQREGYPVYGWTDMGRRWAMRCSAGWHSKHTHGQLGSTAGVIVPECTKDVYRTGYQLQTLDCSHTE
jgi:hypothetical protein